MSKERTITLPPQTAAPIAISEDGKTPVEIKRRERLPPAIESAIDLRIRITQVVNTDLVQITSIELSEETIQEFKGLSRDDIFNILIPCIEKLFDNRAPNGAPHHIYSDADIAVKGWVRTSETREFIAEPRGRQDLLNYRLQILDKRLCEYEERKAGIPNFEPSEADNKMLQDTFMELLELMRAKKGV